MFYLFIYLFFKIFILYFQLKTYRIDTTIKHEIIYLTSTLNCPWCALGCVYFCKCECSHDADAAKGLDSEVVRTIAANWK